jgi:pyruvate decarboxylase
MPDAKGSFPEDHTQFIGVYLGGESSANCEPIVDWADLILAAGPQFTDYTTADWTALPTSEKSIEVQPGLVRFSDLAYTGVELADFLSALAKRVHANDKTLMEYRQIGGGERATDQTSNADSDTPLSRAEMVGQIETDLDGNTTLLVETGDAWFNGMYMRLPKGARFEIEMQ